MTYNPADLATFETMLNGMGLINSGQGPVADLITFEEDHGSQLHQIATNPAASVFLNGVAETVDTSETAIQFIGVSNAGNLTLTGDRSVVIAGDNNIDNFTLNDTGNDHLYLGTANNTVQLGGGTDTVDAQGNSDFITTGTGNAVINETGAGATIMATGSGAAFISATGDGDTIAYSQSHGLVALSGNGSIVVGLMGENASTFALTGQNETYNEKSGVIGNDTILLAGSGNMANLNTTGHDLVVDTGTGNQVNVIGATGVETILGNASTQLNFQNLASTDLVSATLNAKTGIETLTFDANGGGLVVKVGGGVASASFNDGVSIALTDPDAPAHVVSTVGHVTAHVTEVLAAHHLIG